MTIETQYAEVGDLTLAYETFGRPGDPVVLLVMGLGTQMIAWPDELCADLADRGLHVIRFDNRDVGLSTHLDEHPPLRTRDLLRRRVAYSMDDLADDAAGLLTALDIDSAHIVGASLGGFIAQTFVLRHPERARSLSLFMTSTGAKLVGRPTPALAARLLRRRSIASRAAAIDAAVETFRLIGSKGANFDEQRLRDVAGRSYDRAHDPRGYQRQLAAVLAQPNRTAALRKVSVPTLVMHGLADPLVNVSGGRALARAIPGARFVGFPGMGHDLPQPLWPRFATEIADVVAKGEASRLR